MPDLLATKPQRLPEDGNLFRIVVRKEILDWLAHFQLKDGETFDSVTSRLIDHELDRRA